MEHCPTCGLKMTPLNGAITWCEQCGTAVNTGLYGEPVVFVPAEYRED